MHEQPNLSVGFSRVFRAPCREVFEAFLDPKAILAWWAPRGWYTPHVEMDVRVGGRYRFGMRSLEDPAMMFVHGEYLVVDPPHQLNFTYIWEPGGAGERWHQFSLVGVETIVKIRFQDLGDMTEVFLRHEGFPTEEGAGQHRHGWSSNWDCLDDYLGGGPAKPGAR